MNIPEAHQQILRVTAQSAEEFRRYQQLYRVALEEQSIKGIHLLRDGKDPATLTALDEEGGVFLSLIPREGASALLRVGTLRAIETLIQGQPQARVF